jgi:hypothetical protein
LVHDQLMVDLIFENSYHFCCLKSINLKYFTFFGSLIWRFSGAQRNCLFFLSYIMRVRVLHIILRYTKGPFIRVSTCSWMMKVLSRRALNLIYWHLIVSYTELLTRKLVKVGLSIILIQFSFISFSGWAIKINLKECQTRLNTL